MPKLFKRVHIIVIDSVGIGAAPDAQLFGDLGADTLGNIAKVNGGLDIPNMAKLGLGNIRPLVGVAPVDVPFGYYGKMQEMSAGKDTMTGHWEMMGLYIDKPFRVFPHGFPSSLIKKIEAFSHRKVIGNKPMSGTDILTELGEQQLASGALIIYTSADSVLQIAAHEDSITLDELYGICQYCRDITRDEPYRIGRVIARPFIGQHKGEFVRTANRHDYALKPFKPTVMNRLVEAGYDSIALGKIADIFAGEGVTRAIRTKSNQDGMDKLSTLLAEDFCGISFLNLVDFDTLYGHRRDPFGYAQALEAFDRNLLPLMQKLRKDDLLMITADHGNDPTAAGTDHTREWVPLLVYSPVFQHGSSLMDRHSFADLGATIAENFKVPLPEYGESFLLQLL